ncbi:hypothetical protein ACFCX4_35660 [Kitasatospora sp. NPDC056327]|uniref:hypothetical protein n=1 Tax=Kitasatospora sp. NPDC056327 TaxID=3345785 RepID=UPI0035D988FC
MRDDLNDSYQQEFARALSSTAGSFRIDPGPLAEPARARGRRLRRRRRAGALTGAAALALLATGAVVAGHGFTGSGSRVAPAATAPAVPKPSGSPASGAEILSMLTGLLPSGTVTADLIRGTESARPAVRFVLDDGKGVARIDFSIVEGANPGSGCPDTDAPDPACSVSRLPDGSPVVVRQATARAGEPAGSRTWSASLSSSKGYTVTAREWNRASTENGSPVTRPLPPLTTDQLAAVVADPRWQPVAAALAGGRGTPAPDET